MVKKKSKKEKHLCETCKVKCIECMDGDTFVIQCDFYKKK